MKISAGLVIYRIRDQRIEVLLGHMGGPFWEKKDAGAWTIPKGLLEPGEDPLAAAYRECEEEFGFRPQGTPIALEPIIQRGGKKVIAWAIECDHDPATQKSNFFTMEWPPRSGTHVQFPEIDRAAWMTIDQAISKAVSGQAGLFRQLQRKVGST